MLQFPRWLMVTLLWFTLTGLPQLTASEWPELPAKNAAVELPAQEWPFKPGPRTFRVLVHYPGGERSRITAETGLMLTLHNWGGTDCIGTAQPGQLADRLNVVAICVNYLQSGREASVDAPEPYDFGHLQALDALRALWYVHSQLEQAQQPFDSRRIFATGGSGGGNVTLMCNKLAPRTFTGIIDMCGMTRLNDDIAFNLPGGSSLNARWSRDPANPYYLSPDEQELRDTTAPAHLAVARQLGNRCRHVIVHGREDTTCPFTDAELLVRHLQQAELDVVPRFIGPDDLDGKVFTSAGHPLGNRTEIVFQVAGDWLMPSGENSLRRTGPSDFETRDEAVVYPTTNGRFVISYANGYPVSRFERTAGQ